MLAGLFVRCRPAGGDLLQFLGKEPPNPIRIPGTGFFTSGKNRIKDFKNIGPYGFKVGLIAPIVRQQRFGLLAVQGILCFQIAVQGIHSGIHDFISSFFVGGIQVFFNLIIYTQN